NSRPGVQRSLRRRLSPRPTERGEVVATSDIIQAPTRAGGRPLSRLEQRHTYTPGRASAWKPGPGSGRVAFESRWGRQCYGERAMANRAHRPATYEDLCAVPRHLVAEIVRGTLRTHPRPAPRHAYTSSRLGARLNRLFDEGDGGPGGWWILDEPELHFPSGDIVVPDIAGWRVERMPALPETAYFEIVPDWICEVLSPSTAAEDRADKMPIYAE